MKSNRMLRYTCFVLLISSLGWLGFAPCQPYATPKLFGYEKGAFTDARTQRIGKFESVDGGTVFLDEVGELSLDAQVKLLRVLQQGELYRIGGVQPVQVDVRVITATNIDLELAVREGRFRKDLYYRLNVFPIELPPLRSRPEDIPLLAHHFLDIYKEKSHKPIIGISEEAIGSMVRHDWPGNVRELGKAMLLGISRKTLYRKLDKYTSV